MFPPDRARVDHDEAAKRDGTYEALYLDRILESAAEGAVSLLTELPREHLGSLRLMLNQPVPSRARPDIWRLLLKHTAVREEYELLMKKNRNSTISGQDIYITHRCQALLESGRVASRRLLPLTSRNVVLMKTVLSYHHACKMGKQGGKAAPDVPESFMHFLVPLCAVATFPSSSHGSHSRELKIESQIEGLVEMFEAALEAGLEGLVDPHEAGGGGHGRGEGGGAADAGAVVTTRSKKTGKSPQTSRAVEPPAGVGVGGAGELALPGWVDEVHDVLVAGFKGLVEHVTRVHLGLAVAASSEGGPSEQKNEGSGGGDGDGDDDEASSSAAHRNLQAEKMDNRQQQQQQQQLEGKDTIQPPPRQPVSPTSRRAVLKSRRRPPSSSAAPDISSSTGGPAATAPDSARGGGEWEKARDNPTRRRLSIVSPGEAADDAKTVFPMPSDTVPLPGINESQARAALHALLKPLVAVGLVGYLSADACLFAWDQAVIGGFGVMLPRVAAMVVAAAAGKMEACSTFPVMSDALFSHAHLILTSQLQELMEAHCMPSIRKEMRVSEKLSPEIVGPSLKTATEILHRAYSKRTRETQKARKEHVEHVLGPAKGDPINRFNSEERFQLDRPRPAAYRSVGSSDGDSGVDLQYDDSGDDEKNNADDTKGKKSTSARLAKARGGLGGQEHQDKDRGGEAKKKGKWSGMLSRRSTSSSTGASVDGAAEATLARDKTGDHGGSTRKTKPGKRGTKRVETAAGGKERENKAASSHDVNNKKTKSKPKPKTNAETKTKRKNSDDQDSTHESAEDAKVGLVDDGGGSDRLRPKSQKRPNTAAKVGTRKDSSASSSLAQESTGRSLESSQSSHARETERGSSRDDEEEDTSAEEESATRTSNRRRRSRRSSRRRTGRRESADERSVSSFEEQRRASVDGQASRNLEKSSTRSAAGQTSNNAVASGGGGEGGGESVGSKAKKQTTSVAEATEAPRPQPDTRKKEKSDSWRSKRSSHSHVSRGGTERDRREENIEKSAKSLYKTRDAGKQKKARAVAGENRISEGGPRATAPSPEPPAEAAATSASTTAPASPLKRWLGFGGRKKASESSPSPPTKGAKATSRTKTNNNMSSWMLD
eukprot:g8918.t1